MTHKSQIAKAFSSLTVLIVLMTGCTGTRDAALPDEAQESIFAITDFGDIQTDNSPFQLKTEARSAALSFGESAKATAEKGVVAVTDVKVPDRLKFMFNGLEMNGAAGRAYAITLSVDKRFVTAYKIVTDASELSILEKQLAQIKEEVTLQKQLQRSNNNARSNALLAQLQQARAKKAAALTSRNTTLLVPLFKYKVEGFGTLQKMKNELKEDTSTLRLKASEWSEATHIRMATHSSERLPVGLDPAARGELDRTFVMDRINNKIMTAGTLKKEFQIPINTADDTRILTLLDVDVLHVFEIGQASKMDLTDSQREQLRAGSNRSNVRQCPADVVNALPEAVRADCVLVLRYDVPVKYVRPERAVVDHDGNQDSRVDFRPVRAGENVGLVQIDQNVQPTRIESNNQMDPRTTLRVADIKNKEFFFKRTLQDAPGMTPFPPGMAGQIAIIKFELTENRLVVRQADKTVEGQLGTNESDFAELMSIPVKYFKYDSRDASGAAYSLQRIIPASRVDAEFVELDWTKNTLSSNYSPFTILHAQCFTSVANAEVSDVDLKLEKGVLNFSVNYSVGLIDACSGYFPLANEYNSTPVLQITARLKERISFKLNDGSTDVSFVGQVPFKAQNELGFGVWTVGKLNPSAQGVLGREGQEINHPVVHDFRNGKKLIYTVTGLEPNAGLDPEIRQLYRETVVDVVNAWNLAYVQAFKGSSLERSGRYLEVQFAGDPNVIAQLGDLDSNIIHFDNKVNNEHGGLGVSQVSFNPRSGIVVADSLIVNAGNLQSWVSRLQRNASIAKSWTDMKQGFRAQALAELAEQQKQEEANARTAPQAPQSPQSNAAGPSGATAQQLESARNFSRVVRNLIPEGRSNTNASIRTKSINSSMLEVRRAANQMKSFGVRSFEYAAPNDESGWMLRVARKISENPSMDNLEVQGLVAKEMLASKRTGLSATQRTQLQAASRRGEMRSRLKAQFAHSAGCMMTVRESMARDFTKDYKQALKQMLYFDLAHEMGHSQGLTHNFIGSFDKVNFANVDGTESRRNYSSVMDYFNAGQFCWDGIGTYDIHALRASHLGLLEVSPGFKEQLEKEGKADSTLVNGKYISIAKIKETIAPNGWNNFSKSQVAGVLKPFKYCTDIHVGDEPTCQRFDTGTSVTEIVENMIQEYNEAYVVNYHSWDRNSFGYGDVANATGSSIYTLHQMRQFLDELFYKLVLRNAPQSEIQDYVQANVQAYIFFNQLLKTPDATSDFNSPDRFVAVPYQYKELNEKGEETGKIVNDVEIVEKRAPQHRLLREDRIDTVGIEFDKVFTMMLLTGKAYPGRKYDENSIRFSYLDFEKYILGMTAENSFFVRAISGMMLDNLEASFTNDKVRLVPMAGEKVSVTPMMRTYAGITSILNLQSTTLIEKDNFANLFKVGSSIGAPKTDRISLSILGTPANSQARVSFWALDNASASNNIINVAAKKNFFIQMGPVVVPLMQKIVEVQLKAALTGTDDAEALAKAKADLLAKLNEINKDGEIISEEIAKQNPTLSVSGQVDNLLNLNKSSISVALAGVQQTPGIAAQAEALKKQAAVISERFPLFALGQQALSKTTTEVGEAIAAQQPNMAALGQLGAKVSELGDGSALEVSYGMIVRNLEFLNLLSIMTNPELAR